MITPVRRFAPLTLLASVALTALTALVGLLLAPRAEAHSVGLSFGQYELRGDTLSAELTFSRRELADTVSSLDADHDGQITEAELSAARDALRSAMVDVIRVTVRTSSGTDGARCPATIDGTALTEQDGLALKLRFVCPRRPELIHAELGFLEVVPPGHRHIVRASGGGSPIELVVYRAHPGFDLAGPLVASAATSAPWRAGFEAALFQLELGLLLLGLLVVLADPRSALVVSAAFGGGLWVGLWAAGLGLFRPSEAFVLALLRLAIAYLGVEAWFASRAAGGRWRLALPFGSLAGLALAGGVQRLGSPGPAVLLLYALGVSAALLALLVILVPALWLGRRQPGFERYGCRGIGLLLIIVGLARVLGAVF